MRNSIKLFSAIWFTKWNFACSFLQDILKYTEKAGLDTTDLRKALTVMCVVPKAANDMMNVGRLQGFLVSYLPLFLVICPHIIRAVS